MNQPFQVAFIREDECIGCGHCVTACPADAILGASKYMHTVLSSWCIGCKLCIEPCPVDCIEMHDAPVAMDHTDRMEAKLRIQTRRQRLAQQQSMQLVIGNKKDDIKAALLRFNAKKK